MKKWNKRFIMTIVLFVGIVVQSFTAAAAPDPNFHIYLMFGQSNMEGAATPEAQDYQTNSRVMVMQDETCSGVGQYGEWRLASPPLNRCYGGLGPGDYFGKTLAENTDSEITIGLIGAAYQGQSIDFFLKNCAELGTCTPVNGNGAVPEGNNGGYAWLLDLAKRAQQDGVIKGIIMHQGETDTGQLDWLDRVNAVVTDLRNDLGIGDVPFIAGEMVPGACCTAHDEIIHQIPDVISNGHYVSAEGLSAMDAYHFNAEGYREIGRRYADKMLTLVDTTPDDGGDDADDGEDGEDGEDDSESDECQSFQVDYSITDWNTGFVAQVTITNNSSSPIEGWTLTWTFADGQQITRSWNADVSQSGAQFTASNDAGGWNGTIAANGGTVTFGFMGTHSGANSIPVDFELNGVALGGEEETGSDSADAADTVEDESQQGLCQVDYSTNDWNTGFSAQVTIANKDTSPIEGWTLTWTFVDNQQITGSWNADVSQSGAQVTASNDAGGWNGTIAANGGTVTFGFMGTHSGANSIPVDFELNGVACNDSSDNGDDTDDGDDATDDGDDTDNGDDTDDGDDTADNTDAKFVGNITQSGSIPSDFADYWDQITCENEGKWASVEQSRDSMNWSGVDAAYNYAKQNGMKYKHHTFIWGQQYPGWMDSLSQAEQKEEVEEYIRLYCERYPDTEMIDVVNEPDHATPSWAAALGGSGSTGHDWVIWAFEKAREYCPDSTLILNDYNVLRWDTDNFISIANKLNERGLLDAVGCQAHGLETQSLSELQSNFNKVAAIGVPVYISEYDINLADDNQQLQVMEEQFPFFYENAQVAGITLWGYLYGQTWRNYTGLIRDGELRPAMTWLMDYLGR